MAANLMKGMSNLMERIDAELKKRPQVGYLGHATKYRYLELMHFAVLKSLQWRARHQGFQRVMIRLSLCLQPGHWIHTLALLPALLRERGVGKANITHWIVCLSNIIKQLDTLVLWCSWMRQLTRATLLPYSAAVQSCKYSSKFSISWCATLWTQALC